MTATCNTSSSISNIPNKKARIRRAIISFARQEFEKTSHKTFNKSEDAISFRCSKSNDASSVEKESCHGNHGSNKCDDSHSAQSLIINNDNDNIIDDIQIVAPISPTPPSILQNSIPQLIIDVNSKVVELGCGDGRWTISLAKTFGCNCVGVEVDKARLNIARSTWEKECEKMRIEGAVPVGIANGSEFGLVSFWQMDIFEYLETLDFAHDVDVMIMYLFRDAMRRISNLLKERCMSSITTRISGADTVDGSNAEKDKESTKSLLQLLCIGFVLPSFIPVWQSQIDGVRVYLYHVMKK